MLSATLLIVGILAAIPPFVDVFLPDVGRDRFFHGVSLALIRFWTTLDAFSRVDYLLILRTTKVFYALITVALSIVAAVMVRAHLGYGTIIDGVIILSVIVLSIASCFRFHYALQADTLRDAGERLGVLLVGAVPFGIVIGVRALEVPYPTADIVVDFVRPFALATLPTAIICFIFFVPVLACRILRLIALVLEYTVRRIAEYSRGPLFALAASISLLAAIARYCGF